MRACFVLNELGRSGGAATVVAYARALAGRDGWTVDVVLTDKGAEQALDAGPDVSVRPLAEARGSSYDCAIATWWATAASLWEIPARRRLVFLQSLENRFYEERHLFERFAAEQALALPVGFIAVARWMRDVLAELLPDAPCAVVTNGIDKRTFAPRDVVPADGPLRVLVEGQPSLWFKGVQDAVAAVRSMSEPAELTVVAADPAAAGDLGGARVVGGLDPPGMAATYAEHDVLLKLSQVEGLALGPLEAFHVGLPAVLAPFTGHDEYLSHGRNGVVVAYGDRPATTRVLDRLARDRVLLRQLADGALATAREWPSVDAAASTFVAALEELMAAPEPSADAALRFLQQSQRRGVELSREYLRQRSVELEGVEGAVRWHERALEEARAENRELHAALREADAHIRAAYGELEETRSERAYRVAVAARRLLRRGGK